MSQHQEENEAIAHRFNMDIFQEGKLEVADEIIAFDFVWRNPILLLLSCNVAQKV
jgi:hypothetical protein